MGFARTFFFQFFFTSLDHIASKKRRIRYARAQLQKLTPYPRPLVEVSLRAQKYGYKGHVGVHSQGHL